MPVTPRFWQGPRSSSCSRLKCQSLVEAHLAHCERLVAVVTSIGGSHTDFESAVGSGSFPDNVKLSFGDANHVQLSWDGSDYITSIDGTIRLKQRAATFAFQEATTISTTAGELTINAFTRLDVLSAMRLNDNSDVQLGTGGDIRMRLRSTALSADAEQGGITVGTPNHQGVVANSLTISNITTDGDMMFLVSDGGNSREMLKFTAATAEVSWGWGALKIGFGPDLAAITRPASVSADSASIITALVNLGLFTA